MNPAPAARTARLAGSAFVASGAVLCLVIAYVTGNGWFFLGWLPTLVLTTLALRGIDALWCSFGRHEGAR